MRGVEVGQCGTDTEIVADTANIRKTNRVSWQLPPERDGDTGIYRGVMRGPGTSGSGHTGGQDTGDNMPPASSLATHSAASPSSAQGLGTGLRDPT